MNVHHEGMEEGGEGKEISSVNLPVVTTGAESEGSTTTVEEEEKKREEDKSELESVSRSTTTQVEEVKKVETQGGGVQDFPMGPHDEAGEAAEKVAEELFGDDSDE